MCNSDALNAPESDVLVLCRFVPSVLSCLPISRTVLLRSFCFQMTLLSLSLHCQRQTKLAETYSFAIIIVAIIINTINITNTITTIILIIIIITTIIIIIIIIIVIVMIVVIVIVINARTSDKYVDWGNKFKSSSSGILNPLPTLTNMLNGVTRSTYLFKGPKIDHPL